MIPRLATSLIVLTLSLTVVKLTLAQAKLSETSATRLVNARSAAIGPELWPELTVPSTIAQRRRSNLMQELDLSQQQLRQIQQIQNRYQGQVQQQRDRLRQTQNQLSSRLAGNASTRELRQLFRQLQTQRQELSQLQFDIMLEIREVLTPEQRRTFTQIMQRRLSR